MRFVTLLFLIVANSLFAFPISRNRALTYFIRYEGFHMTTYTESNQLTVGIGHSLENDLAPKTHYSEDEIEALFSADFTLAVRTCRKGILDFGDLPADAQLVAISLAYQCGANGFAKWIHFRNALSSRDYRRAATELRRSKWWDQVSGERALDCYTRLLSLASQNTL